MTIQRLPVLGRLAVAVREAPRAVRAATGVAAVLLGVACVLRPFLSLVVVAVLVTSAAVDLLLGAVRGLPPWLPAVVLGGVVVAVLLWSGPVLDVLLLLLPPAVAVAGIAVAARARATSARSGRHDPVRAVLGGAAIVAAAVLARSWPDLAEYLLALVLGLVTAVAGARLLLPHRPGGRVPATRPRRRWPGRLGAGLALVVALVLVAASAAVDLAAPGFLITPPPTVPAGPGVLVFAEPLAGGLPAGAHGWRFLYTTERTDGSPTVASGFIAVGGDPTAGHPVVAWAHGTTGYEGRCAPSTMPEPLAAAGAAEAVTAAVEQGAAVVATDYPGLATPGPQPYLIGRGEGQAVLDAVRAARGVPGLKLLNEVLIWGHSQGGHAALWAGALAPTYAPDVSVEGVAALAPATDLPVLTAGLDRLPDGTIFLAYLLRAYADTYSDVRLNGVVQPGAGPVVGALAGRCLTEPAAAVSVASSPLLGPLLAGPPDGSALGARLRENVPAVPIAAPVLIAQGDADVLVPAASQDGFVRRLCGTGTTVDYRLYPGRDHAGVIAADSPALPDLIAWSRARLMGAPPPSTC